jgi:hypothetical protein
MRTEPTLRKSPAPWKARLEGREKEFFFLDLSYPEAESTGLRLTSNNSLLFAEIIGLDFLSLVPGIVLVGLPHSFQGKSPVGLGGFTKDAEWGRFGGPQPWQVQNRMKDKEDLAFGGWAKEVGDQNQIARAEIRLQLPPESPFFTLDCAAPSFPLTERLTTYIKNTDLNIC